MKNILFISLISLLLGACGSGLNSKKVQGTVESPSTANQNPPVVAATGYRLILDIYGHGGHLSLNGASYLLARSMADDSYSLLKITSSGVDENFGSNGLLKVGASDGSAVLNTQNAALGMKDCNGKIYAWTNTEDGPLSTLHFYQLQITGNTVTKIDIDSTSLTSILDGPMGTLNVPACVGDRLFVTGIYNGDSTTEYTSVISINTANNSIYAIKARPNTIGYLSTNTILKSSSGYYIVYPELYRVVSAPMSFDDTTHEIQLGSPSVATDFFSLFGSVSSMLEINGTNYLVGIDSNGHFHMFAGTPDEIRTAVESNSYSPMKMLEANLPLAAGFRMNTENNYCLNQSGNLWNLLFLTSSSDYSEYTNNFFALRMNGNSLTPETSINNGLPFAPNYFPYSGGSGYVGRYYSAPLCIQDSLFHVYQDQDWNIVFKKVSQ